MSIFSLFKKNPKMVKMTYSGITFEAPKPMSNEEYQEMRRQEVEDLEAKYDLNTVHGINSIPVPRVKERSSGGLPNVTGRIEYYLMRKAGGYEKSGEVDLALACYRKANALMPMSPIAYQYETYMRLPRYLRKLRRFDEARAIELEVKHLFPNGGIFELTKGEFIKDMRIAGHSESQLDELYRDYNAERDQEHSRESYLSDYDWLWEYRPDICPKSFSAYMRMKNGQTETYNQIVAEAQKSGRVIK